MNVIDSCGWIEYLANGSNADFFAPIIGDIFELVVPSISLYEVFKKVLQQRGEEEAQRAVKLMQLGIVVDLDITIALNSAEISIDLRLPMADSIILATARAYNAVLWTQDSDFRNIEGVRYAEEVKHDD